MDQILRRILVTRVLIVDDQPAFRHQMRLLLVSAGLTVVGEAGDIPAAVIQAVATQPDLAVVDVMLPGINGIDGTRHLKALLPDLSVILVSAHRDQSALFHAAAEEVGAVTFIAKDDLNLAVVRSWLLPEDAE